MQMTMHMMMYRMVQIEVALTMPSGMSLAGFLACNKQQKPKSARHCEA